MGWTVMYRYEPIKELFKREVESSGRYKVLECRIVHMTELYSAILDTETNNVMAEVWLLRYYKSGYNFGYKPMSESCGPYYFNCPKSVLDKLTPTNNEYANTWREQCLELINNRKK